MPQAVCAYQLARHREGGNLGIERSQQQAQSVINRIAILKSLTLRWLEATGCRNLQGASNCLQAAGDERELLAHIGARAGRRGRGHACMGV